MVTSAGVVVGGGLVAGDQTSASTYRLDLRRGRVMKLPDLSVPVHDVAGVAVQGRPYLVGGGSAFEQDVVQAFGRGESWRVVGHLPSARSDLASATVGRRIVVIGGYDGHGPALTDVLVSANARRFSVFGRLRVPVRYPAVAVADGAIWVLGGERSGVMVDAVQRIDARTGRVRIVGKLPHPLGHASAAKLGDRIVLAGGRSSETTLTREMWWFDPSSPRFHRAGSLPTPLADSAVVSAGPSVYLIGGETPLLSDKVLKLTLR